MSTPDREVLAGCLRGDPDAWGRLFDQYHPRLVVAIRLRLAVHDANRAEEVALAVWEKLVEEDTGLLRRYFGIEGRHTHDEIRNRVTLKLASLGPDLAAALPRPPQRDGQRGAARRVRRLQRGHVHVHGPPHSRRRPRAGAGTELPSHARHGVQGELPAALDARPARQPDGAPRRVPVRHRDVLLTP